MVERAGLKGLPTMISISYCVSDVPLKSRMSLASAAPDFVFIKVLRE